jgi:hypothetical protein
MPGDKGFRRSGPIPDSDDLHSAPLGRNENTGRRPLFLREMQAATFFRSFGELVVALQERRQ